ncbi:hypothetical protein ACO7_180041 [Thiomonas arsenitoxydans]|nr:hypothetical protein ACO3_200023 [Thiomonas arsenitoxydans]CQR29481.1 hypothetical protein ACO7_180041 [Thiomonas arsenitoxydans]
MSTDSSSRGKAMLRMLTLSTRGGEGTEINRYREQRRWVGVAVSTLIPGRSFIVSLKELQAAYSEAQP